MVLNFVLLVVISPLNLFVQLIFHVSAAIPTIALIEIILYLMNQLKYFETD